MDWFPIKRAAEATGHTEELLRARIARGSLVGGVHFRIAADGSVLFHVERIRTSARVVMGAESCEVLPLPKIAARRVPVKKFPTGPGVYFLMLGREVVYVGQATHLNRRISDHMIAREGKFDAISWQSCEPEELDRLERAYISILQPMHNIVGKSRE